jgi:ribose 5-phosphate isomerase A
VDAAGQKRAAADRAAMLVMDGMRVGLGTGSTAAMVVEALAGRVSAGLRMVGVPTSEATRRQAAGLGITLATLDQEPELDLTIDGADEIAPDLSLIKGGGGALLREKLVAAASRRMVVIADDTKRVARLGAFPLPVEVVPFAFETTRRRLNALYTATLGRRIEAEIRVGPDRSPFVTDGGNWVLDARLGEIVDPATLASRIKATLGVVDHGLFVGMASVALIGTPDGVMEIAPGRSDRGEN